MKKLPDVTALVYRGLPDHRIFKTKKVKDEVTFQAWTSTSKSEREAKQFALQQKMETGTEGVVLKLNVRTAKLIQAFSEFPHENELLITLDTTFLVTKELSR